MDFSLFPNDEDITEILLSNKIETCVENPNLRGA
jgi:hypothetical protein